MSRKDLFFDRRGELRINCDLTFSIQRVGKMGGLAHALDLSSSGIRFRHLGPDIKSDEAVLVQFTLGKSTFSLCGRPVRLTALDVLAQEVALAFAGVDAKTQDRLRKCLPVH